MTEPEGFAAIRRWLSSREERARSDTTGIRPHEQKHPARVPVRCYAYRRLAPCRVLGCRDALSGGIAPRSRCFPYSMYDFSANGSNPPATSIITTAVLKWNWQNL